LQEPFQYISILFALIEVLESIDKAVVPTVCVPVLFDASCSGIHHLSALTRDIEIARKVNIIPEEHLETDDTILDKSTGQDYYLYASKKVQVLFR
jgi:DNA-directed RNA polymerase